jgi:hypothetical protein
LPSIDENSSYAYPPYVTITKEEYELMTSKLKPIQLGNAVHEVDEKFCSNDKCELTFPKPKA